MSMNWKITISLSVFLICSCERSSMQTPVTSSVKTNKEATSMGASSCPEEYLSGMVQPVGRLELADTSGLDVRLSLTSDTGMCFPNTRINVRFEGETTSYLWRVCNEKGFCFPHAGHKKLAVPGDNQTFWFRSTGWEQDLPALREFNNTRIRVLVRPCNANFNNCQKQPREEYLHATANICNQKTGQQISEAISALLIAEQRYLIAGRQIVQNSCKFRDIVNKMTSPGEDTLVLGRIANNICEMHENLTQSIVQQNTDAIADVQREISALPQKAPEEISLSLAGGTGATGCRPSSGWMAPAPAPSPQQPAYQKAPEPDASIAQLTNVYEKLDKLEEKLDSDRPAPVVQASEDSKPVDSETGAVDKKESEGREEERTTCCV